MAKIEFKEGSPIQSLSGTIGNMTFRTRNGRTYVTQRAERELPDDASREEKRAYRRRQMIQECVQILQAEIKDIEEAIRMRYKIYVRIAALYDKYVGEIKARTKLQKQIMTAYRSRYCLTKERERSRDCLDKVFGK